MNKFFSRFTRKPKEQQVHPDLEDPSTFRPLFNHNGSPKIVGTLQDMTEKRKIEEKLFEKERQIEQIYDNLDVGIWSVDVTERKSILYSKGVEGIFGYPAEQFMEDFDLWERAIHPEDLPGVLAAREKLKEGKNIHHENRIIHKSGEEKWVNVHAIPKIDDNGELIRIDRFMTDITEQKKLEAKMRHMAYHDFLTGLPNRRAFDRKLSELLKNRTNKKFAVMYIDLDRFKHINDTMGNKMGDQLLKLVSKRITGALPSSQMAARMSGDEFAIILEEIEDIEEPAMLANEISRQISQPFKIDGFELYIAAAIGVSIYPNNGSTAEELTRNANAALYHAKRRGKNCYQVYNSSMDIEAYKLFCLERDLRSALKSGELYLEYQPRVETRTGRILSAEALIRWNHPEWGRISPQEFIPVAEESGLIVEIGDYIIEKVCGQLQSWKKKGLNIVPVSVNISPQSFLKSGLAATIKTQLAEHGLEPEYIEIELTESSLIHYSENVISALEELGEMGVKIALDDFGTGYSSITQLKKYKFNILKIDKSFIQNLEKSPEDAVITANLIQMARGLNMEVVAEGVETLGQFHFLRQKECCQIQGYLFSKPLLHNVFEQKLSVGFLKPTKDAETEKDYKKLRKFFRIDFPYPLEADMTILMLNNKKVEMGSTKVLIEDMSAGGAKFLSKIKLPVRQDILLKMETELLGETLSFTGFSVWKEEVSDTLTNYGFQFIIDENQRAGLVTILNKLQIQLKKNAMVPECRFIQISSSHLYLER